MNHAVEKHFRRQQDAAARSFKPASSVFIEQNIGLRSHIQREMPLFLTLRDKDGNGLVTAMLPPGGKNDPDFQIIIVGGNNHDPYPEHDDAIRVLAKHFGLSLDRDYCYPYRRE